MTKLISSNIAATIYAAGRRLRRPPLALAVGVLMALGCPMGYGDATDVACTAGLFGACLGSLDGKLRGLIESFENSGKALEAGLGGQIATNVALARAQLDYELNTQISQLDIVGNSFLVATMTQLHSLESQTFTDARKLTKDILDAASAIPFSHREPAVRPLSNPYFAPLASGSLAVVIDGHFVDIGKKGYEATLTLDDQPGHPYTQADNNTDELRFDIPYSVLQRKGDGSSVEYTHFTVSVPFHKSGFCLFDCKSAESFKFTLVKLPNSPGTLVITKKKELSNCGAPCLDTQRVTTPEQFQDSKDNDITEDKTGKLYCFPPRDAGAGWRIQPATVKGRVTQVVEGDQNTDWWWVSNPDSLTSIANACVRMETLHKAGIFGSGHSGKVKFVVDYIEEHDTTHEVVTPVPITVSWGSSQLVSLDTAETWTGRFVQFDGRTYEFADSNVGTPFITVDPTLVSVSVAYVAQNP
jgi:hypothetical protein